jgi:hypothetical protein
MREARGGSLRKLLVEWLCVFLLLCMPQVDVTYCSWQRHSTLGPWRLCKFVPNLNLPTGAPSLCVWLRLVTPWKQGHLHETPVHEAILWLLIFLLSINYFRAKYVLMNSSPLFPCYVSKEKYANSNGIDEFLGQEHLSIMQLPANIKFFPPLRSREAKGTWNALCCCTAPDIDGILILSTNHTLIWSLNSADTWWTRTKLCISC